MNTQFRRGTYPFRAGSANYMRDPEVGTGNILPSESEAGWTRMQNPTIRRILQRFGRRGAQNIAASKLPFSQRWGASVPDESSKFVIGGPSHDEGNFPIPPEISRVKAGQVTQIDPFASKNRMSALPEPKMWDERMENMYGNRLREGFDPAVGPDF